MYNQRKYLKRSHETIKEPLYDQNSLKVYSEFVKNCLKINQLTVLIKILYHRHLKN